MFVAIFFRCFFTLFLHLSIFSVRWSRWIFLNGHWQKILSIVCHNQLIFEFITWSQILMGSFRWAEISLAFFSFHFHAPCTMLVCSHWWEKCVNKTRNAQSSFSIFFFWNHFIMASFFVPLPQWLQPRKCCLENTFRPIDACWTSLVTKVRETYDDDNDTRTRGIVCDTVVVGQLESALECPLPG